MSKVDKPELMKLNNPNYAHLLEKYKHLNGAKFEDPDTRTQIPIHLVLGASDYAKIKTTTAQKHSRSPSLRSLGRKRRLWDNPSQTYKKVYVDRTAHALGKAKQIV